MRYSQPSAYVAYLTSAVETFSTLTDGWVDSRPDSTAQGELAEARNFALGDGVWGESPVREAYAVAASGYSAALDLGRAMAAVLASEALTALPAMTLARSISRVSSQTWWLLDPDAGVKGRVERLQCLRFRGSLGAPSVAGTGEDEGLPHDQTAIGDVFEHSRTLGLDNPRMEGPFCVCGTQRLPPVSNLAAAMVDDLEMDSAYSVLGGFSRGDLFALRQAFEPGRVSQVVHPVMDERMLLSAVSISVRCLFGAAVRFVDLFGLEESWTDFQQI
jgi:hypothetical protein